MHAFGVAIWYDRLGGAMGKKILVVDDEVDSRKMLKTYFEVH